jgi:hypothetical protein
MKRLKILSACAAALFCIAAGPTSEPAQPTLDSRFTIGPELFHDDFSSDSKNWISELENGGKIDIGRGRLDIDVPAGATVWFKPLISGPVLIEYQATAVSQGGSNDRVSDLNCFWMARDARNPNDLLAVHRSGVFADYNQLLTYYVGLGGNGNITTRFRRYIGSPTTRPLLSRNDLSDRADLLRANTQQLIQLVADGPLIEFFRDGRRIFEMNDPQPYTSGWFAFRTTKSHLRIEQFRVFELKPGSSF